MLVEHKTELIEAEKKQEEERRSRVKDWASWALAQADCINQVVSGAFSNKLPDFVPTLVQMKLKIRMSAVRFCPWPPFFSVTYN